MANSFEPIDKICLVDAHWLLDELRQWQKREREKREKANIPVIRDNRRRNSYPFRRSSKRKEEKKKVLWCIFVLIERHIFSDDDIMFWQSLSLLQRWWWWFYWLCLTKLDQVSRTMMTRSHQFHFDTSKSWCIFFIRSNLSDKDEDEDEAVCLSVLPHIYVVYRSSI